MVKLYARIAERLSGMMMISDIFITRLSTVNFVGNGCQKGHRLLIDGRLQIRSYEAKEGGKRWVTEIIANSVEFVEKRSDGAKPVECNGDMEAFGQAVPADLDIPF